MNRYRSLPCAINVFVWLSLMVMSSTIATAGYWTFIDTKPPITFEDINLPVIQVKRGEPLRVPRKYCMTSTDRAVVHRFVIDGFIYNLSSVEMLGEIGCHEREIVVQIPEYIQADYEFVFQSVWEYHVNPITTVMVKAPDVRFKVVE